MAVGRQSSTEQCWAIWSPIRLRYRSCDQSTGCDWKPRKLQNGPKALTDKARRNALLPLQYIREAEATALLPLCRELAKRFWPVHPEHPFLLIDEMAILPVSDPYHAINLKLPNQLEGNDEKPWQWCCNGNQVRPPPMAQPTTVLML